MFSVQCSLKAMLPAEAVGFVCVLRIVDYETANLDADRCVKIGRTLRLSPGCKRCKTGIIL